MIIQEAEEWLYRIVVEHDFFEFSDKIKIFCFDFMSDNHDMQKRLQKSIKALTSILEVEELTETDIDEIASVLIELRDNSNKSQASLNGTISNNL